MEKACMYGECSSCKDVTIPIKNRDINEPTTWLQWKTKKEVRSVKHGGEIERKEVAITVKEVEEGTIADLRDNLYQHMARYKIHSFNIANQYAFYRDKVQNMSVKECLVHVDFSENYYGKMSSEVQSMHFGASKTQITLHTGVFYIGGSTDPHTFCTASDSLNHGPQAVWTHMKPVLEEIRGTNPQVETIHFFSDGPVTQYRQKGNFFLFSTIPFQNGFTSSTWNFNESGHGKGIPDAVGGSLKRSADRLVLHGHDITNAQTFVSELLNTGSKILLYHITSESINKADQGLVLKKLPPVPGTMKIHQVLTSCPQNISYRDISCTCVSAVCKGHELKQFSFESVKYGKDAEAKTPKAQGKENMSSNVDGISLRSRKGDLKNKSVDSREAHFSQILSAMNKCSTFAKLASLCSQVEKNDTYHITSLNKVDILKSGLCVDMNVIDEMPSDFPGTDILYPVRVSADGNCLPHCGSVFAFGNENHVFEIRARIITEQVLNKNLYLSNDYMCQGITPPSSRSLPKQFAMYSDHFIPGIELTSSTIETIYENEILAITKPGSYMGIWQMFALSTILKTKLYSVYPNKGNKQVRSDLHRQISPRQSEGSDTKLIMWCSTRKDMRSSNWLPNHFVPLLPIDSSKADSSSARQTYTGEPPDDIMENSPEDEMTPMVPNEHMEQNSQATSELKNSPEVDAEDEMTPVIPNERMEQDGRAISELKNSPEVDAEDEMTPVIPNERMEQDGRAISELKNSPEVDAEDEMTPVIPNERMEQDGRATSELKNSPEVDAEDEMTPVIPNERMEQDGRAISELKNSPEVDAEEDLQELFQSKPQQSLGNLVCLIYDGMPYPGKIIDTGEGELFIESMHYVGRNDNLFFWPRMKDHCWYMFDNILGIIPKLIPQNTRHFSVPTNMWERFKERLDRRK
ncbi:uncharacterized protein LOC125375972 [Haliotis rufescens]|uniref:uncharacterized protein LOC125375972 n=1 Tax=Haliotis rufescens TaxID=6454 RepID=UPI00201EC7B6|nr:uncharacterized protein LOC125375972 [Haliotis rufescens]